ncbi:MAG: cytochrome b [Cellvibrionaceae bacterium]|nr:cytochrome b [Cellvibrionaceae bacterium]
MKNSENGYGWLHITIHWLTALTVLCLFIVGLWMVGLSYYSTWYHRAPLIHQSVGTLLVLLTAFRLFWRAHAGMPTSLSNHKVWEKLVAKIVHGVLYLLIISMFFSGYLIATAKGQPFSFFGLPIPALITGIDNLEDMAADFHEIIAFSIVIIAALHGVAALKHHIIDKDTTLKRMLKPTSTQ